MGAVEDLAAELAAINRRIARGPQLGYSSIPHGRDMSLDIEDADGNFSAAYGTQWDGTHGLVSLTGPKPPQPTAPTVTPGPMTLTVRWNGLFANGALSPMDFSHVEVHVSSTPDFIPSPSTLRATLRGELGDETVVSPLTASQWHARLVARTLSSKASTPSTVTSGTPEDIADSVAGGKITVSMEAPTLADGEGKPVNATWSQIDAEGAQIAFFRWTGAEWVNMPLSEVIIPAINIGTGVYGTLKGVNLGADTFKGALITGAIIQTDEAPATGIKLDTDSFDAWDASGHNFFHMDPNIFALTNAQGAGLTVDSASSSATYKGNLRTMDPSGGNAVIELSSYTNASGGTNVEMALDADDPLYDVSKVTTFTEPISGDTLATLEIAGPGRTDIPDALGNTPTIKMRGQTSTHDSAIYLDNNAGSGLTVRGDGTSRLYGRNGVEIDAPFINIASMPWRYVGDAGEPAFQNGYANNASQNRMRFRRSPLGRWELAGELASLANNGGVIFTLPSEAIPAEGDIGGNLCFWQSATPSRYVELIIYGNGDVVAWRSGNDGGTYITIPLTTWEAA